MQEEALQFTDAEKLGRVVAVDTTQVHIDIDNHDLLTRASVSKLIGIQGSTGHEYLISVVERVTRRLSDEALVDEPDAEGVIPIEETKEDRIRAVLIGTFYLRRGETLNVFKRGADTFPQIDRECYLIEAGNLERFMSILAIETPEDKRLTLGNYILDPNSEAIADGDRFFQRHAAILGSTGSGKSWTVALLLERAQSLSYPNLIVFDMHGEYAPLATINGGFAQRFSIAGPGDLGSPDPHVLFLPSWVLNLE